MIPAPPDPELRRLVDRLLDGESLDRTGMARLEDFLETPAGLDYFLSLTTQEGLLPEALATASAPAATSPKVIRFPWRGIIRTAAACLIFIAGLRIGIHRQPAPAAATPPAAAPARITGLMGVEWNTGWEPDLLSQAAAPRRLAITSGLVEITYASGVRVTLEGPADFTVNDPGSGKLDAGKLVASVPKGAEGFRVDYAKGNVVDLGTEFAMDARKDGTMELGVLDGKVNLNLPGEAPRPLLVNQAVIHRDGAEDPLQSIPFDREKFVRRLPARDFRWSMTSLEPRTLEFDVTHLIWKSSSYRAVFKWINGRDAIVVRDVGLYCDGALMAEDPHTGRTGALDWVDHNLYQLDLLSGRFHRGRWTIRATIEPLARPGEDAGPVLSEGILQLEEGMVTSATAADFIGKWSYTWTGRHYIREFLPDGTVNLSVDDMPRPGSFAGSHWTVRDGILRVPVPGSDAVEEHVLRDPSTLIFTSQPYGNAAKVK